MTPDAETTVPREPLPAPGVRFGPDFLARVERLLVRLAGARERREGPGRSALSGGGEEFVGFRPYRPGEDLRSVDWNLLARLDRPFVRVSRREAGERWAILLDASASMGVGPPGKLVRAAEVGAALACAGRRIGATVRLIVSAPPDGPPREFALRSRVDPRTMLGFLEGCRAAGDAGLAGLLAAPTRVADAGRVFVVGDLLDVEFAALAGLGRRGRELGAVQLLAPVEFEPPVGAVEWWDPEGGERLRLRVDRPTRGAYERRLEERLDAWRVPCARHRIAYTCASTAVDFEDVVGALLC
ncbi:MAG: DUF58 domain-containing protein [Planctomycetota bacterium]|nr:DUF58 domain-containing protein [Planctomycetota bacterium]MDP6990157.1 DUF58 domain-containing protein [Planctomycetota bacterium]